MTNSYALFARILPQKILMDITVVFFGIIILSLLAQVSIPIPGSPVPVTGQTFGITLMALNFGRRLGVATVIGYLVVGALGFPVFALGHAGLILGPTSGYLVGMLLASVAVGWLADRGFCRSFLRAWFAGACGSTLIFACGLANLSLYVDAAHLMQAGLWPFLPGDLIKTVLAASLSVSAQRLKPV